MEGKKHPFKGPLGDASKHSFGDATDTRKPANDINGFPEADSGEKVQLQSPEEEKTSITESRFWRKHMKGEYVEDKPGTVGERLRKMAGTGLMSGISSVVGVKFFADAPRYFAQKYYKAQEKGDMREAFFSPDMLGSTAEEALNARVDALKERMEASKHLSPDERKKIEEKIDAIQARFYAEQKAAYQEFNEEVLSIVDRGLESRVKGEAVVREGVSTALVPFGLFALRGATAGAVRLGARAKEVREKRKEGELDKNESFLRQWIADGARETVQALAFNAEGRRFEKSMKFAEAVGTVARVAGFTGLGAAELATGEFTEKLGELVKAVDEKSLANFMQNNLAESVFGTVLGTFEVDISAGGEVPTDAAVSLAEVAPLDSDIDAAVDGMAEAQGAAAVELGTVRDGDGIVMVFKRQFVEDPARFGFEGDVTDKVAVDAWAANESLQLAKESNFITPSGDTWLKKESVGSLSIALKMEEGGASWGYFDPETGTELESLTDDQFDSFMEYHEVAPRSGVDVTDVVTPSSEGEIASTAPTDDEMAGEVLEDLERSEMSVAEYEAADRVPESGGGSVVYSGVEHGRMTHAGTMDSIPMGRTIGEVTFEYGTDGAVGGIDLDGENRKRLWRQAHRMLAVGVEVKNSEKAMLQNMYIAEQVLQKMEAAHIDESVEADFLKKLIRDVNEYFLKRHPDGYLDGNNKVAKQLVERF